MVEAAQLPTAMRDLVDAGFATIADERIASIPAIAQIIESQLAPAERRSAHARVASLLGPDGHRHSKSLIICALARSWTPEAGEIYVAAGELLTRSDPATALTWYDDAIEAGISPGCRGGRACLRRIAARENEPGYG